MHRYFFHENIPCDPPWDPSLDFISNIAHVIMSSYERPPIGVIHDDYRDRLKSIIIVSVLDIASH